ACTDDRDDSAAVPTATRRPKACAHLRGELSCILSFIDSIVSSDQTVYGRPASRERRPGKREGQGAEPDPRHRRVSPARGSEGGDALSLASAQGTRRDIIEEGPHRFHHPFRRSPP